MNEFKSITLNIGDFKNNVTVQTLHLKNTFHTIQSAYVSLCGKGL